MCYETFKFLPIMGDVLIGIILFQVILLVTRPQEQFCPFHGFVTSIQATTREVQMSSNRVESYKKVVVGHFNKLWCFLSKKSKLKSLSGPPEFLPLSPECQV